MLYICMSYVCTRLLTCLLIYLEYLLLRTSQTLKTWTPPVVLGILILGNLEVGNLALYLLHSVPCAPRVANKQG